MAINFGIEPPRWLQEEIRGPGELSGALGAAIGGVGLWAQDQFSDKPDDKKIGFQSALATARGNVQDPLFALKREQAQNSIYGQTIQLESAYSNLKQKNAELAKWQQELPTLAPWISAGPEGRKTQTRPSGVTSGPGLQMIQDADKLDETFRIRQEQQRIAADRASAQTIGAKIAVQRSSDFIKELAALDADLGADIPSMQPNKDGTPTTAMWQALNLAKQAQQQRKENAAAGAEVQAQARGEVPTTTIGEVKGVKKVTTTYKPTSAKMGGEPIIETLPTGQLSLRMPGSSTIHVLSDKRQEQQVKIAETEWKRADADYRKAALLDPNNRLGGLPALKQQADDAKMKLMEMFGAPAQAASPAAPATPRAAPTEPYKAGSFTVTPKAIGGKTVAPSAKVAPRSATASAAKPSGIDWPSVRESVHNMSTDVVKVAERVGIKGWHWNGKESVWQKEEPNGVVRKFSDEDFKQDIVDAAMKLGVDPTKSAPAVRQWISTPHDEE